MGINGSEGEGEYQREGKKGRKTVRGRRQKWNERLRVEGEFTGSVQTTPQFSRFIENTLFGGEPDIERQILATTKKECWSRPLLLPVWSICLIIHFLNLLYTLMVLWRMCRSQS